MSKSKTGSSTGIGVGSSSILAIFVVLCLTTFATLSMVSANADYKLTKRAAQHTLSYYAADSLAEERLAQLANCINSNSPSLPSAIVAQGFFYEIDPATAMGIVTYDIEMGNNRKLHVVIATDTLQRLCWQVQTVDSNTVEDPGSIGNIGNLPIF